MSDIGQHGVHTKRWCLERVVVLSQGANVDDDDPLGVGGPCEVCHMKTRLCFGPAPKMTSDDSVILEAYLCTWLCKGCFNTMGPVWKRATLARLWLEGL